MAALEARDAGKHRSARAGMALLAGIALLTLAIAIHFILLERNIVTVLLALAGAALAGAGAWRLRSELGELVLHRRGAIMLEALAVIGILLALGYLSVRFPARLDMSSAGLFSLAPQTVRMLERLERPVRIAFFHDPMMRETVELYRQMVASSTGKLSLELFDPMLNPAQARLRGVEFAGTALMESEGRKLRIHGSNETDIANGILRVSQGAQQTVCFLDGHGEADPFSLESHDHLEGAAGHSHGLGTKFVLHERHGMAKARASLEALNYNVEKVQLAGGSRELSRCALLVIAGPKTALAPLEIDPIRRFLQDGGNALLMLDPFVPTGLEPLVQELGIQLDDTIVIDPASHFWTDVSAPAVTDYNRHEVTRELPLTFFPGARSLSPTPKRVANVAVRPIINSSKRSFAQSNAERVEFDASKDKPGPTTLMAIAVRDTEFTRSAEAVLRELQGKAPATPSAPAPQQDAPVKRSRVAVIGDSDFATNSFFHIMGNGRLFLNTVNYLAAQENLIGVEPRTHDLPRVNLTNRQMKGTFLLSIVLIPALMAIIGIAVWWRQR